MKLEQHSRRIWQIVYTVALVLIIAVLHFENRAIERDAREVFRALQNLCEVDQPAMLVGPLPDKTIQFMNRRLLTVLDLPSKEFVGNPKPQELLDRFGLQVSEVEEIAIRDVRLNIQFLTTPNATN